jgi:hypothetical protein
MVTSEKQSPFEIPAYFEAINLYGEPVPFTVDFSREVKYYNLDDKPIAHVPDVAGGGGVVFFCNPPQLFPSARVMRDGDRISKEEFGELVNQYHVRFK